MPRKMFIIIALICLTLSVIVWAQDKSNVSERIKAEDDYNKVTALIYRGKSGVQLHGFPSFFSISGSVIFVLI